MTTELEKYQNQTEIIESDSLSDSGYLPYITISHGMSEACTENGILPGRWTLNREDDLGEEIDLFIALTRMTAVDTTPDNMSRSHNIDSPEFQKIKEGAKKDSRLKWGREALVYVFTKRLWATYLIGNKTTRKFGALLVPQDALAKEQTQKTDKWVGGLLGQPVTVSIKSDGNTWKDKETGKTIKASWFLPVFKHLDPNIVRDRYAPPDLTGKTEIYEQFMNPPQVEVVEQKEDERPR